MTSAAEQHLRHVDVEHQSGPELMTVRSSSEPAPWSKGRPLLTALKRDFTADLRCLHERRSAQGTPRRFISDASVPPFSGWADMPSSFVDLNLQSDGTSSRVNIFQLSLDGSLSSKKDSAIIPLDASPIRLNNTISSPIGEACPFRVHPITGDHSDTVLRAIIQFPSERVSRLGDVHVVACIGVPVPADVVRHQGTTFRTLPNKPDATPNWATGISMIAAHTRFEIPVNKPHRDAPNIDRHRFLLPHCILGLSNLYKQAVQISHSGVAPGRYQGGPKNCKKQSSN